MLKQPKAIACLQSIAFPAISTGIYGFPKALAAKIAVAEATSFSGGLESIIFVCFDEETYGIYQQLLQGPQSHGIKE
jgi:O-acetyl-ADP-ribose deacetylase (regulator of RNase III)